jgi:predicted RNase H-like nuclease
MFKEEEIYQAFSSAYPLLTSRKFQGGRVSFETFPHAIACALRGMDGTFAKEKRHQRPKVLEDANIDATGLKSIDDFDAALCALTARYLIEGQTHAYGDAAGGYIRVPLPSPIDTRFR